ncbi:MAG: sulfotransferase domain-containing protein [bacterium]
MSLKRFIRKIKYGKPIIIVSGLPRSGTSMMMKMVEAGGVEIATDGIRSADDDNPKGYYELERVKDLDKHKDKSWLIALRGKAVKIISYFLKELPDENNYKVIFIERNLQEISASQNKMLSNRGEPLDPANERKIIEKFETHLKKVRYMLCKTPHFETIFINHREVLNNPYEQAKRVNKFLGGCLNEEKMTGVVDQNLYRNRK